MAGTIRQLKTPEELYERMCRAYAATFPPGWDKMDNVERAEYRATARLSKDEAAALRRKARAAAKRQTAVAKSLLKEARKIIRAEADPAGRARRLLRLALEQDNHGLACVVGICMFREAGVDEKFLMNDAQTLPLWKEFVEGVPPELERWMLELAGEYMYSGRV